ncbi:hypothetical protein, partial [Salmonella sp. s58953]|uniref:hypothetical protein n=1 Tax=Salmonella sp. s58953 TaxID=3159711 RepID=UPI0039816A9F
LFFILFFFSFFFCCFLIPILEMQYSPYFTITTAENKNHTKWLHCKPALTPKLQPRPSNENEFEDW